MKSNNEYNNEDIPSVIHANDSTLSLISIISTDNDNQFSANVTRPSLFQETFRGFNRDSPLLSKGPSKPQRKQSRDDLDIGQSLPAKPNSTHNASFTTYTDPMNPPNPPSDSFQMMTTTESPGSRRSSASSSTKLTTLSRAPSKPQRKESRVDLGQSLPEQPNSAHNFSFTTYSDPMNPPNPPCDRFQMMTTTESPAGSRRSSASSSTHLSKAPSKPQRKRSRLDLGQSLPAQPNSTHNASFTTYSDPMNPPNPPCDRFQMMTTTESPASLRSSGSSSTTLTMPVRKASSSSFYNPKTRRKPQFNLHNAIFKKGNERSVASQIPSKGHSPMFLKNTKKQLLAPLPPKLFKWISSPESLHKKS
jgi:hypothetical protein